ncbi:unnamed protein product [Rhizoctonia solani]|uniref:AAA+ ATPase domain-containing protein n=1 Tax=Rhizoctonia solani TaxID=456999 RepID=A0A8H3CL63_9AGAM|nr:unnamed protein product [Rhizoctonia solani]
MSAPAVTRREPRDHDITALNSHWLTLSALSRISPMRAIRVRLAIGRPPAPPKGRSTSAFSSSVSLPHPRKIPPDFPHRVPTYAYASADETQGPVISPKPAETETDQDQEKPRKRVGRPPGNPNKTPPPPPAAARASVNPESIWAGKSLGEGEARTLPPEDMLQDALAQLLVTLQPQTQYRAAYSTGGIPLVEPTLALYCPIEGGDYVIDDTVKELAGRVNGDVIVIDAAQLAAGEHGSFGKAASILKFPQNPLHFPSTGSPSSRPISEDPDTDDDDLDDDDEPESTFHRVTFGNVSAVAIPARSLRVRGNPLVPNSSSSSASGRDTPMGQSELKNFFESIINAPVPSSSPSGTQPRPRIIYLRDFSLLAPSASTWYPALLSAIRSRRQGHLLRPSNPLPHPTTLILGVSPSSVSSFSSSPSPAPPSPASGIMNILMGQRPRTVMPQYPAKEAAPQHDERETRLRERLKRWSRSGSVLDNLPAFTSQRSANPGSTGFMSANGFTSLFGAHPSTAREQANEPNGGGVSVGTGSRSGYFRACGVVPASRDEARERSVRRARRMEINALVVRMALGAVGGKVVGNMISGKPTKSKKETEEASKDKTDSAPADKMVDDWSRKLLDWSSARRLADRALAHSILSNLSPSEPIVSDETAPIHEAAAAEEMGSSNTGGAGGIPLATPVSWEAVRTAWDTLRLSLGHGEKSTESAVVTPAPDSTPTPTPTAASADSSATPTSPPPPPPPPPVPKWSGIGSPREPVPWIDAVLAPPAITTGVDGKPPEPGKEDDLVERVKNDPDLEPHEDRLLGCIVNPAWGTAELQTTFAQVHLPDTTIDSVRTLVSLPLLYPAAFRSGILAQHAMTGALLFGPPGTGKTLLAKALAKESGARMMVVKPSDVMDMYVGEGEKLVRSVFSLARRLSPCIVFLDEIDALLGARSSRDTGGAASAHRGLVTEFMQEMDGLRSSASSNVVVIGATNRPFDLDDAVLRRLPRRLLIDLPGLEEREAILRIMLKGEDVAEDVDVPTLAKRTDGFSGSDLKNLVVAAALDAVKEKISLPWRTRSGSEKGSEKQEIADAPEVDAANVAPDATSSDTLAPGTQTVTESSTTTPAQTTEESSTETKTPSTPVQLADAPTPARTLRNEHFSRALKEITPSASEALGTLADLRKWNAEFGGGDRKKSNKAWGGRFGFGGSGKRPDGEGTGRVAGVVDERL